MQLSPPNLLRIVPLEPLIVDNKGQALPEGKPVYRVRVILVGDSGVGKTGAISFEKSLQLQLWHRGTSKTGLTSLLVPLLV